MKYLKQYNRQIWQYDLNRLIRTYYRKKEDWKDTEIGSSNTNRIRPSKITKEKFTNELVENSQWLINIPRQKKQNNFGIKYGNQKNIRKRPIVQIQWKVLQGLEEGLEPEIHKDHSRKYRVGKRQPIMACIESGFKHSHLSMKNRLDNLEVASISEWMTTGRLLWLRRTQKKESFVVNIDR